MRILLFGKDGQVGWELARVIAPLGELIAVDQPEIDFLDLKALQDFTLEVDPDLIINAAAYTAVDKAESEPEMAMTINGQAPGVLAEAARKSNAGMVHYSTDYVFDGAKGEPYSEEDEPQPINVYGETKLAGDRAIQESGCEYLILRTSWVYGARGKNFFLTILRLARELEVLSVVDDQVGCPTWCRYIAETTSQIVEGLMDVSKGSLVIEDHQTGIYNYSSSGPATWFQFSEQILNKDLRSDEHIVRDLVAIGTSDYPTDARRPEYSVLSNDKIFQSFGIKIKSWEEHLDGCWAHYQEMYAN
jgi:dTDP-4-dehydrorhamnose reductase